MEKHDVSVDHGDCVENAARNMIHREQISLKQALASVILSASQAEADAKCVLLYQ